MKANVCVGWILGFGLALIIGLAGACPAVAEEQTGFVFFPERELFGPLVADPKEPRFFASLQKVDNEFKDTFTGAFVGYGETFGLVRQSFGQDHGWQLSLRGGLFAQFDMDTSSNNLQNADYTIGALLSYRYEIAAVRFRLYHQSSHLGDDFILAQPELSDIQTGFDYEAADILFSLEPGPLRLYGGYHHIVQQDLENLKRGGYQAGIEYHGRTNVVPHGTLVGGVDVKAYEQLDWEPGYSVKAGLHFAGIRGGRRYIQLLLEYYDGFVPFGQFYEYEMESYGAGIYLGF